MPRRAFSTCLGLDGRGVAAARSRIGSFCKPWPKSGLLTWSVLAYWAYALKQIYKEAGMAAVLSKEALGPAACAIAAYFLLANLPELLGIALRAGTGG